MTWVDVFPAACGVLYLAAAAGYAWQGAGWLALAYAAYALANVGLIGAAVAARG